MDRIQEKLEELEKLLDNYLAKCGLTQHIVPNQSIAEKYIRLTPEELRQMTAEECGEACYVLRQFAFYLQKEHNKQNSKVNWCNSQIDKIISGQTNQYGKYSPYEERKNQAIKNDVVASKLNEVRINSQEKADRLNSLSFQIKLISDSLLEIQQNKRRQS